MPSPRWPSARADSTGPRAAGRGEYGCGERTATPYIWPCRRTRMRSGPSPLVRTNGGFPAEAWMAASSSGRSRVGSHAGQACRPWVSTVWPLLRMETCLPVGDMARLSGCGRLRWARPWRTCRILARSPRWPGARMDACSPVATSRAPFGCGRSRPAGEPPASRSSLGIAVGCADWPLLPTAQAWRARAGMAASSCGSWEKEAACACASGFRGIRSR